MWPLGDHLSEHSLFKSSLQGSISGETKSEKPREVERLTPGHTASLRLSSQGLLCLLPRTLLKLQVLETAVFPDSEAPRVPGWVPSECRGSVFYVPGTVQSVLPGIPHEEPGIASWLVASRIPAGRSERGAFCSCPRSRREEGLLSVSGVSSGTRNSGERGTGDWGDVPGALHSELCAIHTDNPPTPPALPSTFPTWLRPCHSLVQSPAQPPGITSQVLNLDRSPSPHAVQPPPPPRSPTWPRLPGQGRRGGRLSMAVS